MRDERDAAPAPRLREGGCRAGTAAGAGEEAAGSAPELRGGDEEAGSRGREPVRRERPSPRCPGVGHGGDGGGTAAALAGAEEGGQVSAGTGMSPRGAAPARSGACQSQPP